MKRKFVYVGLVLLSAAILVYSCSKGYNSSSPYNPGPTGATASVTIQTMAFMPDTLSVKTAPRLRGPTWMR